MTEIALSIVLDKHDKTYECGETIAGQVRVVVTEDIQIASLMVVLFCRGISKAENIHKTIEEKKEEINLFKGSWMQEEYIYPFEIVAPHGPRTYKGHIFDVTWHLGTKVRSSQGEDVTAEAEIMLLSEKRKPQDAETSRSQESVHIHSARSLKGCFGFSIGFFLLGVFIAWRNSPFAEREGDEGGVLFFGGIILILLGSVALFLTIYTALVNRRIKEVEVRLGSRHAGPGEKIPFSVTFEANISFIIDNISATLRCNEVLDFFSSSSNKKYLKHRLYENRQELPLSVKRVPTKVPIQVEGEILIPEDAPCSMELMESGKGMLLKWEIEFVIEMKKWPDWIHFEDITVSQ
ncbi:MAG: hypothetical protein JW836_00900 [Deltaproteobacteria bacterium]|nr:hypothetical protein [Deltaproteobacteria bacterium]